MSDSGPDEPDGRTRIAILGGGCGGLAAAWALTASPALRQRFEVTVYEASWALGGKGASGRNPHSGPDGGRGQRIEEHGLHIWFGFYEHAFRMLREAYRESGLADGDDWWTVPFQKCDGVCLYEQRDDGSWCKQAIHLPRRGGLNRGPPTEPRRLAVGRILARTTRLLATGLRAELGVMDAARGGAGSRIDEGSGALATLERIAAELDAVETPVTLGEDPTTRPATRGALAVTWRPRPPLWATGVEHLTDELFAQVRDLRARLTAAGDSDRMRLWRGVLELVAASLAGIVRDDVLWRGFGALDEEDLRAWLRRHGASEQAVSRSPVLRGLYDLTFAYRGGDKSRPSLAAGKGLQSLLMMINYEGSFMWRMRAGMGDVVFAPLYLALKQRGVKFHFFSRVTQLRLMPGRPIIDRVELTRDAAPTGGPAAYEPIELAGEWWCWPAAPDRAQLAGSSPADEALERGVDFDEVVLAIPLGALPEICRELAVASPRFRLMLERGETVQTKGLQLWLTKTIKELQGTPGRDDLDPPSTAYAEPFDTYCDMSHLLEAELYGRADGPQAVAYFCAVLPDREAGKAQESVRAGALEFLEGQAAAIWPHAVREGEFDWDVLFDPHGRTGRGRLGAQYLRANVAATDRYVTTPAGTVDARLDPDQSGFENLTLAGDWTHNGIDGGCVEAAVISGEWAAAAIIRRDPRATAGRGRHRPYIEYGALATAPGPLLCERARLYCFMVRTDRARVQQLCDRVLKEPTAGALRYLVPRLAPVVLTFGTIAGLRSLHPDHAGRGSASEPEAAIWVPTIAQRYEEGRYVDEHLAVFMPYLWVDDPIAFASGREVYGFAKTQGWMQRLEDPRGRTDGRVPDPPESLALDVYGAAEYGTGSELGRQRLITIRRRGPRRDGSLAADRRLIAEGDRPRLAGRASPHGARGPAGPRRDRARTPIAPEREGTRGDTRGAFCKAGAAARLPQADPRRRARRARRASAGGRGALERLRRIASVAAAARVLRAVGQPAGESSARG